MITSPKYCIIDASLVCFLENNLDVEAPPSSPSSDRSVGDGSSCDTPTSRSSLSEDGRPNNGKYCDCCYCEFFGNGNVIRKMHTYSNQYDFARRFPFPTVCVTYVHSLVTRV